MTTSRPSNVYVTPIVWSLIAISSDSRAIADDVKHCPDTVQYTFEKGDSLSEVLYSLNVSPLYGRHGAVAKMVGWQPEKFSSTRYGHVQAGTQMTLRLTDCPDPTVWLIENGVLLKRPKVVSEPNTPSPDGDSEPLSSDNPERHLPPTGLSAPAQDVEPSLNTIVEPVREIVPPPMKLDGELNDENLNKLLNL